MLSALTEAAFWEIGCAGSPVIGGFTDAPVVEGFTTVIVVALAVTAAG